LWVARSIYFVTSVSIGANDQPPLGQRKVGMTPVNTEDKLLEEVGSSRGRCCICRWGVWPGGRPARLPSGANAKAEGGRWHRSLMAGQTSGLGQRPTSDILTSELIADLRLDLGLAAHIPAGAATERAETGASGLAAPSTSYVPPLLRGPRGIAASAQDLPRAQLQWGQTRRPAGTGMPQQGQRRNPGIAPRRLSQSATSSTATPTTTRPIEAILLFSLLSFSRPRPIGYHGRGAVT